MLFGLTDYLPEAVLTVGDNLEFLIRILVGWSCLASSSDWSVPNARRTPESARTASSP